MSLPFKCHYSYSYYNLALMIIYLLSGEFYETNTETTNNAINIEYKSEILLPYIGTKLYFFLMRCLSDTQEDRCFLYI